MTAACVNHGRYRPPHPPKRECPLCWAAYGMWVAAKLQSGKVQSKGRARGGGRSSKAKGRAACVQVAALLCSTLDLLDADVHVKATSQMGVDLHLSPRARALFPFSPEVKCQESLNIWEALRQAESNATPELPAVVLFKRAHTPLFAALDARVFLELVHASRRQQEPAGVSEVRPEESRGGAGAG